MSFEKNNYLIIKEAIDKNVANFVYDYFLLKSQVVKTFYLHRFISPFSDEWGVFNDNQVPGAYSHYADIAMEVLLSKVKSIIEEKTKLELIPTYSYARIYNKGDTLKRHKDRFSCEISTTLNLGGDRWPIYIEASKNVGTVEDGFEFKTQNEGTKVLLNPGDMLIYKGNLCEHWREKFEGDKCGQVFLHYNNKSTKGSEDNKFDNRPHLGLPSWFKNKKLDES